MTFAHDTEAALQCAAALINTGRSGAELLPDPAALDDFARSWKWTGPFAGDADELAAVHAIRVRLAPLWEMPEDEAVELVNTLLREERVLPQLVRHPPVDYWHVHAVPNDAPLAARMAVDVALAVADLIRAGELARMRVCTAPDCDDVFIDLSKNRSRRFCGTVCSNRVNVAAYRQRHTSRPLPMATRVTRTSAGGGSCDTGRHRRRGGGRDNRCMPLLALLNGPPGAGSTPARMYGRLLAVAVARPQAAVVRTEDGQVEQAYRDVLAALR